ncbi:MAG: DUF2252 domain-containing protein [Anaerolineae bacterium]
MEQDTSSNALAVEAKPAPLVARLFDVGQHRRAELLDIGRSLRSGTPRLSLGTWHRPDDRPTPLATLEGQAADRVPYLLPLRYGRMLASPFAFYRGNAAIMAWDLARSPSSGINVQACGDAHLMNFGVYGDVSGNLIFDINDFDETLPAPFEWDVKRLAASFVVATRDIGLSDKVGRRAAQATAEQYRLTTHEMLGMTSLDIAREHFSIAAMLGLANNRERRLLLHTQADALRRTNQSAVAKLSQVVDGRLELVNNPPLVVVRPDEETAAVNKALSFYQSTLPHNVRHLLSEYTLRSIARKVVGVGSVGLRTFILLFEGKGPEDGLLLQAKQAPASVMQPYAGASEYVSNGERVVAGQRIMQALSDPFLGWLRLGEWDFYFRQFRHLKTSVELQATHAFFENYARLCGATLAHAHARSVDPALIAGYLGKQDNFDRALADFATAYADQTERDYKALKKAAANGDIVVEEAAATNDG